MVRAAAASVCLLALTGAVFACESFSEGGEDGPASNDAGSGSDTGAPPVPTGDGGDAGEPNPVVDAGPTFCTGKVAVFCDDFEQPGRKIELAAPWDEVRAIGAQEENLGAGNMSPHGFRVTGLFGDKDSSGFGRNYDIHGKKVRFAFDIKVDKLADGNNDGVKPVMGVAAILFGPGKELDVVIQAKDNGTLTGFVNNMMSGFPIPTNFNVPLEPSLGTWTKVAIEYESMEAGVDEFRVYFGSGTAPAAVVDAEPPAEASALAIGADVSNAPGDVDVSFDNVLITELP